MKIRVCYRRIPGLAFSLVLLLALLLSASGHGQTPADVALDRFKGKWHGDGKTFGMTSRLELNGEWVLGNRFLRLSLRNEIRAPDGKTQVFEGHAYYRPLGDGKYEGNWFDSRGKSFPIKAGVEGDSLVAFWGTPDEEEGKSVYRLVEPGKIEVVDAVRQKDGTWREFGRVSVTKQ